VPSGATVRLIVDTFGEIKKRPSIGRAEALRRAELGMPSPETPPEFAHPMMWAPFVLVGEGPPSADANGFSPPTATIERLFLPGKRRRRKWPLLNCCRAPNGHHRSNV
jgi:hypothetical protein